MHYQITLMPVPPKHPVTPEEKNARRIYDQMRKWIRRGMSEQDAFARASRVAGICAECGAVAQTPLAYTCRAHILEAANKRNTAFRAAGRHRYERQCKKTGCENMFKGAAGRDFCDEHYTLVKRVKVKVKKSKRVFMPAEKPTAALVESREKKIKQEAAVRVEKVVVPEGITVTRLTPFGWMAKGLRELIADELSAQ